MNKLFAVLLLIVPLTFAEEPIKFRGAYIGQPMSDWVDCSSGKPKVLADGFKAHGKLCEGKGTIFHMKAHSHFMKGVTEEGEAFGFVDKKLAVINIMIPNDDWEKVKYDLTQKLGEPQSEAPTVYQNGFGAKWEYGRGFWVKGDIVAAAGVKVEHLGNEAINNPFTNQPETGGIELKIMSAERAKVPSTRPNSLD